MSETNRNRVAILMGSVSDEPVMKKCSDVLDHFGVDYEVHILSAHRNPDEVDAFAMDAEGKGFAVIIAGAGMAAHLPGVLAAKTVMPVIGVPLEGSALGGLDALFSMVQMPSGIPVATVSIGSAGAKNSAILAVEILALSDSKVSEKLKAFRKNGSRF